MTADNLLTHDELAQKLRVTPEKYALLWGKNKHRWPHVRLDRFEVRFTPEQFQQIVALHTPKAEKPAAGSKGQSPRSASYHGKKAS